MKIGIITYHFVYNCGAALQCYAMQKVLNDMGHSAVVINYKPWYMNNKYTHFKNPYEYYRKALREDKSLSGRKAAVKAFWDALKTWKNFFRAKINDDKFRSFRTNYFKMTRTYRTIKQLRFAPPSCDIYLSGSDQLWNPYLTDDKPDPAYFLDFGGKRKGRITYALGTDVVELEKHRSILEYLLRNLRFISLREKNSMPFLQSLPQKDTEYHIDIDPTLLIEKEDFIPLEVDKLPIKKPFILMYTMPDSSADATRFAAHELGKRKNMDVIDIAMRRVKINGKMLDPHVAGPDEFLSYMHQAEYVFTNSFHGTAFSVIYEKQFMAIPHRKTGHRVIELLEKLGLQNRWRKTGGETLDVIDTDIDYDSVKNKREELRSESLQYLKYVIEHEGDK